MNLFDSAFLCLDIGAAGVRGIANRVRSARIDRSAVYSVDSTDTAAALKTVIDELERQIGAHFDTAYVTGDFGECVFKMEKHLQPWSTEHKITPGDIRAQIASIPTPDGFFPMHIVPRRYDTTSEQNLETPVGHSARALRSIFSIIFYTRAGLDKISSVMRRAHIQPNAFFDPHFLLNARLRAPREHVMFIDFGAVHTTISLWTPRGPVMMKKLDVGGAHITRDIADKLGLRMADAERVKHIAASLAPQEMDRFTPADPMFDFSRADLNEIILPRILEITHRIQEVAKPALEKYRATKIMLCGGGAEIDGAREFFENMFSVPTEKLPYDASVRALSDHIWAAQAPRVAAATARAERMHRRFAWLARIFRRRHAPRNRPIPIMPSTLCFDMNAPETYSLFKSGGISMIHVDIMDGFYVPNITGDAQQLRKIRANTSAHLHVHLMTESPATWAEKVISAGADTIIVSPNTSGMNDALEIIRRAGRRAGIALPPDAPVGKLKNYLRNIDEVMLMAVRPGASGQPFDPSVLKKIAILKATREKYDLKFKISVDGGINDKTAPLCWAAGADALVSGSYLARAADFPLAVQSLLRRPTASQTKTGE